ncbi:MAG: hypothetical protein AB7T37_04755 [Dehalococcoidia bacterium]
MYQMKGNRGSSGDAPSNIPIDIDPPAMEVPPPGRPRRGRRWLIASVAGALALATAAGVFAFAALRSDDSSMAVSAASEATAISAATIEPASTTAAALLPSPTSIPATASPVSPTPTLPAATPTFSLTASSSGVATPASPAASPAAASSGRVRYVIQSGDACDLLRARFGFAPARWEDFIQAMATLSGRPGPDACAFSSGNVVCIPALADVDALAALRRDDACLAGP